MAPGSINVNDARSSITLSPGDYVAANINVNYPGSITVSPGGPVRIWVTGTLNLGGNENLNGSPENLAFLVTSSASVNVNSNGSLYGLLYKVKGGKGCPFKNEYGRRGGWFCQTCSKGSSRVVRWR
jgi:hypothetical protein